MNISSRNRRNAPLGIIVGIAFISLVFTVWLLSNSASTRRPSSNTHTRRDTSLDDIAVQQSIRGTNWTTSVVRPLNRGFDFVCDGQSGGAAPSSGWNTTSTSRFDAVGGSEGGKPVKVRFIAMHTKRDRQLFEFLASARLAGVPVDIVGIGWRGFNYMTRHHLITEYIKSEGLSDEDVIIVLDTDILFTGMDLYPIVQRFVQNSPASAAECDARQVRLGTQTAPLLFSGENHCQRMNGAPLDYEGCSEQFDVLESIVEDWAATEGLKYYSNARKERNENRFLNGGFMIGRCWALHVFKRAFFDYITSTLPYLGKYWWSDQAISAALYLNLYYWEITTGVLTRKERGVVGPSQLISGMISLDVANEFVGPYHKFNVPSHLVYAKTQRFMPKQNDSISLDDSVLQWSRQGIINRTIELSFTSAGAAMAMAFVSFVQKPNNIRSNDTHFGVPISDGTEPVMWHFCGLEKKEYLPAFLQILPTVVLLDVFPEEMENTKRVFHAAPPNRVWVVDEDSTTEEGFPVLRRAPDADFNGSSLCSVKGSGESVGSLM